MTHCKAVHMPDGCRIPQRDKSRELMVSFYSARRAAYCGDKSTAWEVIANGRVWTESHSLHH